MNLENASREELLELIARQEAQVLALADQVKELTERVAQLEAENLRLRRGGGSPLDFSIKPSRSPKEKKARKHRAQTFVRRREEPDEIRPHTLERCPDCGRKLSGGTPQRSRQVIEVELRSRVVEHVALARWCGVCGKRWLPQLTDQKLGTVGKQRFGASVQSLVTVLNVVGRLPVRIIRGVLQETCGLHISNGAVVKLLDGVKAKAEPTVQEILEQVRDSTSVCADETGWREDGVNGYLWTFSTPTLRYFVRDASRSGRVPREVLGENFAGTVTCDFYAAYNQFGAQQRCWFHLLQDAKELAERNEDRPEVKAWEQALKALYQEATDFIKAHAESPTDSRLRRKARRGFERAARQLARPYARDPQALQRVLAQRILKHLPELFVFVTNPAVPPTNNLAERSLRPAVIARKISGGTRSRKGSETKMKLMSLFGTWRAQGKPLHATCQALLLAAPARSP